jgi:hypothetical protein
MWLDSVFQIFQKTAIDHRMENSDIRSQHLEKITQETRPQYWAVNTVVVVVVVAVITAAAAVALICW